MFGWKAGTHSERLQMQILTLVLVAFGSVVVPRGSIALDLGLAGSASLEARYFPQSSSYSGQFGHENTSLALQPELFYEWDDGYQRITFSPFMRWDQNDEERTHWDVRELYYELVLRDIELRVGARQIFWGVTESQHLIDIINQTDQLESVDGEDNLGQPMLQLSYIQDWGTLDAFLMSGFRERTFAGSSGRLRPGLQVLTDRATYESSAAEWHVDWALRWSHYYDVFDFGISHFSGTGREPVLLLESDANGLPQLRPHYVIINQTSLDVQATVEGWLFKLEALTRGGQADRFYAMTGGFEYTFGDIWRSGTDVGLIAEYSFDERGTAATTPFDDDFFFGTRVAFNDVQSTDILAGVFVDRNTGAGAARLEAGRRIGDAFKLSLEMNGYFSAPRTDLLYDFRNDSHIQLEFARYF